MKETRRGMLLVIAGPSGTGKGTLISRLMAEDDSLVFSVSATTRAPRENEIDGVHYHFITEEKFESLLAEDAFLEHDGHFNKHYGTLKSEVYGRLENGQNVVLDIDVNGAENVMAIEPDCVSVFILPPSLEELKNRLLGRGTETPEQVEIRLARTKMELERRGDFRYQIVNDDLDAAAATLKAIVTAEKQRTARYTVDID